MSLNVGKIVNDFFKKDSIILLLIPFDNVRSYLADDIKGQSSYSLLERVKVKFVVF